MISGPLLAAMVMVGTIYWWLPALGRELVMTPCEGQADAIVVLGGGGPERVLHGMQLYLQGVAPRLWFTGDRPVPEMTGFTDGLLARDMAVRAGIPVNDIGLYAVKNTG